jgi:hypothetical protein
MEPDLQLSLAQRWHTWSHKAAGERKITGPYLAFNITWQRFPVSLGWALVWPVTVYLQASYGEMKLWDYDL